MQKISLWCCQCRLQNWIEEVQLFEEKKKLRTPETIEFDSYWADFFFDLRSDNCIDAYFEKKNHSYASMDLDLKLATFFSDIYFQWRYNWETTAYSRPKFYIRFSLCKFFINFCTSKTMNIFIDFVMSAFFIFSWKLLVKDERETDNRYSVFFSFFVNWLKVNVKEVVTRDASYIL